MPNSVVEATNICKVFDDGGTEVRVLNSTNLTAKEGELIAIVGHSGSGKSTLLNILGLAEAPTSGTLLIGRQNPFSMTATQKNELVARQIGIVYQFHHLMQELSILENTALSLQICGVNEKTAKNTASEILDGLGLGNKLSRLPSEISGGERQRVAIARAIAKKPKLILCDEPTGSLDAQNSKLVFDILISLCKEINAAMVCATHNHELAKCLDEIYQIKNGFLEKIAK